MSDPKTNVSDEKKRENSSGGGRGNYGNDGKGNEIGGGKGKIDQHHVHIR